MTKSLRSEGHIALINALIEARKAKNMTQAELASLLSCHQSFVARIESGQRRVDVSELVILSRALDVDASVLLAKVSGAVPLGARI
ncbi:MAG: helix-turn-helix transcriptional regulator [Sulfitobacter sp.]